jgi:hypothetical protein
MTSGNVNASWRDYVPVTRAEIRAIIKDEVNKILMNAIVAATDPRFDTLDSHIEAVEESVTMMGEKVSEATDLLDQLDARTNELGAEVDQLIANEQNRPDADPAIVARLTALRDNLNNIAADPNNPVPDPVPVDPAQ